MDNKREGKITMPDFILKAIQSKHFKELCATVSHSGDSDLEIEYQLIKSLKNKGILIQWDFCNDDNGNLTQYAYCYYRNPETGKFDEESFEIQDNDFDTAVQAAILYGLNL